jgi:hypothetical protein
MQDWIAPKYFAEENSISEGPIIGFKVDERRHFDPELTSIAREFCEYYQITDKFITQFLVIEADTTLPWHEDGHPASCCVNVLLSKNNSPIEFPDGIHYYETALLNIREKHRVTNDKSRRIMFRIVFYDEKTQFSIIKEKINDKDISS